MNKEVSNIMQKARSLKPEERAFLRSQGYTPNISYYLKRQQKDMNS